VLLLSQYYPRCKLFWRLNKKEMGVYLTSADDVVKGGRRIGDRGIAEGVGPCARYRQRQGEGKEGREGDGEMSGFPGEGK